MNIEDIIRMAREAGLLTEGEAWVSPYQEAMERFATLVAEHERERCAELRSQLHFFCFDKTSSVGKQELVGLVNQALDDYQKLIRTGDV